MEGEEGGVREVVEEEDVKAWGVEGVRVLLGTLARLSPYDLLKCAGTSCLTTKACRAAINSR